MCSLKLSLGCKMYCRCRYYGCIYAWDCLKSPCQILIGRTVLFSCSFGKDTNCARLQDYSLVLSWPLHKCNMSQSKDCFFCFLLLTGFYTLYMTYCIYDDDGGDCVQCPLSIMLQNSEHTDNADTRDDGRKIGLKNCKQWDLFEALPLTLCAKLSADHALPANLDHFRVFV